MVAIGFFRHPSAVAPNLTHGGSDEGGLAAATHFVIAMTESGKLGYVKLNRILWYADLEHYRWRGSSVTGLRQYTRTMHGPMAARIPQAVSRLAKEGKIAEKAVAVADYVRREMVALQPPDFRALTDEQIRILSETIRTVAPMTANELRELTHADPLWREVSNGDAMLVATGSIISPRLPRDASAD